MAGAMWLVLPLLAGCDAIALLKDDSPPRNCETRQAFWPDADGDGVGEPTDVLVGCEAPDGWVAAPADGTDTDPPAVDTASDTGAP